jgi:uncharacterized protein (DUF983 family)
MRRRPRGRTILLCPSCRSPKIYLFAGALLGQIYRCESCGYEGPLVLEQDVPPEAGAADRS